MARTASATSERLSTAVSSRPWRSTPIREIADQLFLFGTDRDHRLAASLKGLDLRVEVGELSVAVWVPRPFFGLAGSLQAVTQRPQQFRHRLVTDPVPPPGQLRCQLSGTLARAAQWRHRVASGQGARLHKLLNSATTRSTCASLDWPLLLSDRAFTTEGGTWPALTFGSERHRQWEGPY
jgi:hypothetical protein